MSSQRHPGEQWTDADGVHIEVRGLAPPSPFVMILKLLAASGGKQPIVVHHDRDPLPLYSELAQRGWSAERIEGDPGEVRLRLTQDC